MSKTVQPKTARNKPGVSKTEIAEAEALCRKGEITGDELAAVKTGKRRLLTVDGEGADFARTLAKRHGTTPAAAVESALTEAYEKAKGKRARLSVTPSVARMFHALTDGAPRAVRVNAESDLLARMIQDEHARQHEAEREPVNARMRAAVATDAADVQTFARAAVASVGCIQGEFGSRDTPAARAILTACELAERLAGLLGDTAEDLEGQLRKLAEEEAGLRFTVESVTKAHGAALVRLAIAGREPVTLRLPLRANARQYNDTLAFLRAVGDTLPLTADMELARPPRPDWGRMAGRSGRCRMDGDGLAFLIPATDGGAMPFIVAESCKAAGQTVRAA